MLERKSVLMLLAVSLVVVLAVTPFVAKSRRTFYTFEIMLPEEVEAEPGQEVTIEGGILVTGYYWLHNFDMTASGMPYEYEIEPEWWEHVRILRDWNPDDGLYRVPETFSMTIKVPEDASGSHVVTVTGQEHQSFRQVSNFSYFVLRVAGEPIKPQLTISDILVPEMIDEGQPFQLAFRMNNDGPVDTKAVVSLVLPEGWEADEVSQEISIKKNESAASAFSIIPTDSPGEISLKVEYPFRTETITFTKEGPYLIPSGATTTTQPQEGGEPIVKHLISYVNSLIDAVANSFQNVGGPYLTSITIGIIFVLFVIIIWLIIDIIKFVRKGSSGKGPEEAKPKTKISDQGVSTAGVTITEV